ncbi:MAG: hypothetical protein LBV68_01240 [Spirochaetaceae bacterium]|jgi:hypothetical protein|nr:hypothetical protein [Spirochaetaceae bacterium]
MGIVTIIVIGDFFISGLSRRTITFYAEENREPLIEERFISWKWNEEKDIHAFVEEILLGPEYPDTAALLDRGTRLETFFYRDGRAVIGLSEEAAIPIGPLYMPRADIQESLRSISRDLRRNFLSVHEIYFFIAGREVKIEP